jgi:uncharacterized membrane protein
VVLLIIGLVIFFAIHFVPSTPLKTGIVGRIGTDKYKIVFSLASFLGLALIIYGFSLSTFVPLWEPLPWGRAAALMIMPVGLILLVAANMPNNLRRLVRHPMLLGITLWGGSHLAANGDLASTLIFASFAGFSIIDFVLVTNQGRYTPHRAVNFGWDLAVVAIGLVFYGVLFKFHGVFTGMPLI